MAVWKFITSRIQKVRFDVCSEVMASGWTMNGLHIASLGPIVFKRSIEHVRSEKNVPIVARSSVVSMPSIDFRNPARPGAGFTHWQHE
jgi:hypothetical protein